MNRTRYANRERKGQGNLLEYGSVQAGSCPRPRRSRGGRASEPNEVAEQKAQYGLRLCSDVA